MSQCNCVPVHRVFDAQSRGEQVAIADVRSFAEFHTLHAVGARSHPLETFDPQRVVASFDISGLGRDVPLYVTCQSGRRAEIAASRLIAAGYPNVTLIAGGTQAWESANLPVVRARVPSVLPLAQQTQVAIGVLLLLKTFLGVAVHPVFFALTAAIGAGLVYAGLTQNCALTRFLSRMPWNRPRTAEHAV